MSADVLLFSSMDKYPNRIRELRLALGFNQERLAALVGCSKMQISGLERGKPKLDVDWMRRIAPPLRCTPADLLKAEDNPWQLSAAERDLLLRYRAADASRKEDLDRVADALVPFKSKPRDAA